MEGAVLGTVAVGLVMWLAGRLFDPAAAYVGGAIAAVYPGAIGCSVFVLSEAPYAPLLVAQVALWTAAWRAPSWRTLAIWAAMAGLAGGTATLVRPSHLLFTPFALAAAMFGHDRRRNIVIGAFMLAALAVTMSPWWVRNYRVKGRFIATTLQMGASLYDGLNPNARGGSDMQFIPEFAAQQRREDEASVLPLADTFEERLDSRLKRAAIEWSLAHPLRVAQLACVKLLRMWSPLPNASEFQSWIFRVAILSTYTPLIVSAVWGAWHNWRRGWPYVLCLMPAIYLTLVHMVFVSSIRYREPAMLVLIVLAAGVWHVPSRLRGVNTSDISTAGVSG
jgi:hypothetical protein